MRYKDLNLNPLEHNWDINPRLYEGIRNVDYSGMTDLVDVIDRRNRRRRDRRFLHATSGRVGRIYSRQATFFVEGPKAEVQPLMNAVRAKFAETPSTHYGEKGLGT